jgi:GTPase SAR1 family protein
MATAVAPAPLPELGQMLTAKLVLLGEMGAGKSSLVLRFVKGQFFDYQVGAGRRSWGRREKEDAPSSPRASARRWRTR